MDEKMLSKMTRIAQKMMSDILAKQLQSSYDNHESPQKNRRCFDFL